MIQECTLAASICLSTQAWDDFSIGSEPENGLN